MTQRTKWICKCGLKHNISNKNITNKLFKKCPYGNFLPSEKDIQDAIKIKVIKKL